MKNYINWKILYILFLIFILQTNTAIARENVIDWYIKDFNSQITVNNDSTLDIVETITADCGNAPNKHGIFRILPTSINISGKKINMPIELISITDDYGKRLNYQTIKNSHDKTITWKIGDPDIYVHGVNTFKIHYKVKNVIRFNNEKFDELYWNLNGNFWDLEIDNFHASIIFPDSINKLNTEVNYYTGSASEKNNNLASYEWTSSNILEFNSNKTLFKNQGITASVIFPKNIITPYKMTFLEQYGEFSYFLIVLFVFLICFKLWKKYGDDPNFDKTIIAEFEIPDNLSPIETGMLMKSGKFDNAFITAEIIFLATKGYITIKELEKKSFLSKNDYQLTKTSNIEVSNVLNEAQLRIYNSLFKNGDNILLSSLKNNFYQNTEIIKKSGQNLLKNKKLITTTGLHMATFFRIIAAIFVWLGFALTVKSSMLGVNLGLSALILLIFSFIMPKRTLAGTELNWKISGFKLFMETVDKDRAVFYEKENIFEKCLPYAIVFGMTKLWIQKIQKIYGNEYLATHAPVWYTGNLSSFDADNFSSSMNNLTSQISANTSSPSGSGGGGFSGGGGGGGGGGGW